MTPGLVLLLVFTFAVVFATRRYIHALVGREKKIVDDIKQRCENALAVKKDLEVRHRELESEVAQIYTLYDMTREITKSFSEDKTFQTFKTKLKDIVEFGDCVLLDPLAQDQISEKERQGYKLLNLTGQRRRLGILALKDLPRDEEDKVGILANQFALALNRVRLYQDIERLAITDSLTGCYTRRYVMERFEEERGRAQINKTQMAFLMIDLDHFKKFNDQYGHLTGDQILREIASIIKSQIREIDLIGRYGGEEFCVLLPDTDYGGAQYVAERIRSAVENADIKAYDTQVKATVSVGISVYPRDGRNIVELIDKADWALYRAKKDGRNRICGFGVYNK